HRRCGYPVNVTHNLHAVGVQDSPAFPITLSSVSPLKSMSKRRHYPEPDLLSEEVAEHRSALARPAAVRRAPTVLTVGLFVTSARLLLERELGLVWVSGEISNFMRAGSGHCYFN